MAEGVLGDIAAAKRIEIAQRFDGVSIDALRHAARPTGNSLAATIARPGARFVLEIKKASPSAGAIRPAADPAEIARHYDGVADALSVLTDTRFFRGSVSDLGAARSAFRGPILAKDFFLDPRQIVEARLAGADAVLVMLSLLGDRDARAMIEEAARLGMDSLVEVHDQQEMCRAIALRAPLIGINNRDLRDLSVDLSVTERLAPLAAGRILIAESGIADRADVDRLAPLVDGFLIGSSLMRHPHPAEAARALVFRRVKMCGLNRIEDVAASAPATYAGFVFVSDSPRYLSTTAASPLVRAARSRGQKPVGIFRDEPIESVAELASRLSLEAVQLHGTEDGAYIAALRRRIPERCEIWGAVNVGQGALSRSGADRLLFDNGAGGTGRSFDWDKVRSHPSLPDALVAGGIGPNNALAAASLGAHAIDVGSAVDAKPGVKSASRIRSLFETLRPEKRLGQKLCA